ncbi:MAG TPA: hypothetical protein VIB00_15835 [Pyrinomonadaceae bacterium]
MKRFSLFSISLLVAIFACVVSIQGSAPDSQIKEYKEFHDVLHPLEHEALPKKDYESVRTKADELVRLGNAIIKLGVPRGTQPSRVQAFEQELENFNKALKYFSKVSKSGKDEDLRISFSAVHDSYEMLAGMLPRG